MFEDIQNDPTWKRFKKLKSASAENTFSSYETALKSFGKFIDKSPTEIHDLHRADLRNRLGEFDWWLSKTLDDYVYFLIDSDEIITKPLSTYMSVELKDFSMFLNSDQHQHL